MSKIAKITNADLARDLRLFHKELVFIPAIDNLENQIWELEKQLKELEKVHAKRIGKAQNVRYVAKRLEEIKRKYPSLDDMQSYLEAKKGME